MKKKSLGQVLYEANFKDKKQSDWDLLPEVYIEGWEQSAKVLAREVRKRDKEKYNMQFQNEDTI